MGLLFLVVVYLLFCSFFAFLAAAFLNKVFRQVLRFRADWTNLFTSSLLICVVTGVVFCATAGFFRDADLETLKTLGATFAFAFITAVVAFKLILKSESGRSLSWLMAITISVALSLPPLGLISLISLLSADH